MQFSRTILLAAALSISASAARSDDASDAKGFLAGVFATYKDNSKPPAGSHHIYDSQLQKLMDEDTRLANGEVPALDFDPVCQCQDYEKIEAHITVRSVSPKEAVVALIFHDLGMPNDKPRDAVFDLVKEGGLWRIHDIHAEDPKSLRAFLTEQNAERMHPPKGK